MFFQLKTTVLYYNKIYLEVTVMYRKSEEWDCRAIYDLICDMETSSCPMMFLKRCIVDNWNERTYTASFGKKRER